MFLCTFAASYGQEEEKVLKLASKSSVPAEVFSIKRAENEQIAITEWLGDSEVAIRIRSVPAVSEEAGIRPFIAAECQRLGMFAVSTGKDNFNGFIRTNEGTRFHYSRIRLLYGNKAADMLEVECPLAVGQTAESFRKTELPKLVEVLKDLVDGFLHPAEVTKQKAYVGHYVLNNKPLLFRFNRPEEFNNKQNFGKSTLWTPKKTGVPDPRSISVTIRSLDGHWKNYISTQASYYQKISKEITKEATKGQSEGEHHILLDRQDVPRMYEYILFSRKPLVDHVGEKENDICSLSWGRCIKCGETETAYLVFNHPVAPPEEDRAIDLDTFSATIEKMRLTMDSFYAVTFERIK